MTDPRVNVPITGDRKSIPGFPGEALPTPGDYWATQALAAGETNMPRDVASAVITLTSGTLRLSAWTAQRTETITQVGVISHGTAASVPTLIRVGIYTVNADGGLTLVASTPNDTALFAAAFTRYTKALSAPWVKQIGQRYAAGVLVVATAAPSAYGDSALTGPAAALPPVLGWGVVAADLPTTGITAGVAAANVNNNRPYVELLP